MPSLSIQSLPVADRVEAIHTRSYTDHRRSRLFVQYIDHNGKLYELEMPFLSAMYLMSLFKGISRTPVFSCPPTRASYRLRRLALRWRRERPPQRVVAAARLRSFVHRVLLNHGQPYSVNHRFCATLEGV